MGNVASGGTPAANFIEFGWKFTIWNSYMIVQCFKICSIENSFKKLFMLFSGMKLKSEMLLYAI